MHTIMNNPIFNWIKFLLLRHKLLKKFPSIRLGYMSFVYRSVIGKNVIVYDNVLISDSSIGDYSYVGSHGRISRVTMGKFCSIASDVYMGLGRHPLNLRSTYPGFYKNSQGYYKVAPEYISDFPEYEQIVVGNDVWVGTRAMVMDGVTIGDGAVVAAGAVVTKDIPPYAIVGGVPAKIIRFRFSQDKIDSLLRSQWWNDPKFS